ncbi:MAG: formylglycine-generating enzyme family protein, partial [Pedobacter sp.]
MFKKVFAAALILLIYGQISAQTTAQSYTQNIDGTKLTFDMQAIPAGKFQMGNKNGK